MGRASERVEWLSLSIFCLLAHFSLFLHEARRREKISEVPKHTVEYIACLVQGIWQICTTTVESTIEVSRRARQTNSLLIALIIVRALCEDIEEVRSKVHR